MKKFKKQKHNKQVKEKRLQELFKQQEILHIIVNEPDILQKNPNALGVLLEIMGWINRGNLIVDWLKVRRKKYQIERELMELSLEIYKPSILGKINK